MIILISNIVNKNIMSKKDLIIKNRIIIIYHLLSNKKFIKNIPDEEVAKIQSYDKIQYQAGGSFIDNICSEIINKDKCKIFNLEKLKFNELLNICVSSSIKDKVKDKNKRRQLTLLDKILLGNYYHCNMPHKYIGKKYSIEHITPHSSSWEGELDIDRLGNQFPTLDEINISRSNKDISIYKSKYPEFYSYIETILPNNYNDINKYENRKTKIISNEKYNEYCLENEHIFIKNLVDDLYL